MTNLNSVKLIECPRDAMQGIKAFIPTQKKASYIQSLLKVGFDTIDFGSFVSHKVIPQMADTAQVLSQLDMSQTQSKLLVIVANVRGAIAASKHSKISYLGFPFSISENFQMRNTHQTIPQSVNTLSEILEIAHKNHKTVVVYMSMGFGNPYGDPWSVNIVEKWTNTLSKMGVRILSLSDTIGCAKPEIIGTLFSSLIPKYPHIEFGAHLHSKPKDWFEKVDAAYTGGCCRFDGAIQGFGGCPMASNRLTGNIPSEKLLSYFTKKKAHTLDAMRFENAYNQTSKIFLNYC